MSCQHGPLKVSLHDGLNAFSLWKHLIYIILHGMELKSWHPNQLPMCAPLLAEEKEMRLGKWLKKKKKEESVLSTSFQDPLSLCCSSPVCLLSSGVWQSFTDGPPVLGSRMLQCKDLGKIGGTGCFRIFSQGGNSVKRWLLLFPH